MDVVGGNTNPVVVLASSIEELVQDEISRPIANSHTRTLIPPDANHTMSMAMNEQSVAPHRSATGLNGVTLPITLAGRLRV